MLRNKLGIVDPVAMGVVESAALRKAYDRSLDELDTSTRFSVELLKEMHRGWLGKIYDFAGQIRTVNLSKGRILFAPLAYLENTLRELDIVLASNTPCEGMARPELVRAIALVHAEFELAHPFREGNGRLGRWLADLMAMQAGYPPLDWGFDLDLENKREAYFSALWEAYLKNYGPLEELISSVLKDS